MEKIGFEYRAPSGRPFIPEGDVAEKLVETIKKVNEIIDKDNKTAKAIKVLFNL